MALTARWCATERVVAAYNLLLAAVWIATGSRLGAGLALAHVTAAALPLLFDRAAAGRPGGWVLRDLYPALLLAPLWGEIDVLRHLDAAPTHDAALLALDRAVFGTHLTYAWVRAMPWPWLSEVMEAVYYLYYFAAFLPPLVLAFTRRREALRDAVACLMVTYLACYVVYVFFPVNGPREVLPRYVTGFTDGFWWRLNQTSHDPGDSAGTAFPSSHVAGVVAMAFMAWRWFPRPLSLLFAGEAVAVCFAVVYTQNHYPLDVLSGLVVAFAVQYALVGRVNARTADVAALPPLAPAPSTGD